VKTRMMGLMLALAAMGGPSLGRHPHHLARVRAATSEAP
jgi:hypothetical protein